jgi:hypothetical protein
MKKISDRTLTDSRRQEILEKYDHTCMYCLGEADQVDHILPWSYRHDDSEDNLVACCWLCNVVASNKIFKSFKGKKDYIQKWRNKWLDKHAIALWTKEELKELGYRLKQTIEQQAIVLKNDVELERTKELLEKEGYKVIVKGY